MVDFFFNSELATAPLFCIIIAMYSSESSGRIILRYSVTALVRHCHLLYFSDKGTVIYCISVMHILSFFVSFLCIDLHADPDPHH